MVTLRLVSTEQIAMRFTIGLFFIVLACLAWLSFKVGPWWLGLVILVCCPLLAATVNVDVEYADDEPTHSSS